MNSVTSLSKVGYKLPPLITLQSHILAEEQRNTGSTGTLSWIISALSISAKTIAAQLKRARLDDVLGEIGSENIQGEQQQKLDVIANNVLIQQLKAREGVAVIGSEEDDELIFVDAEQADGTRYAVMFDPLDGSSNLDVGSGVGTIFSVFPVTDNGSGKLLPGSEQAAAGYVLYGSSTIFVMTVGTKVPMFVLDTSIGAFIRVAEHVSIPKRGNIYSVNEANVEGFSAGYREYLTQCRNDGFGSRYSGAMVADVHRILIKGGVFLYPPTEKVPEGKLRLMYEANPMAMIVEAAGGKASTGTGDILDVNPRELHQRIPVILGSHDNVSELLACLDSE